MKARRWWIVPAALAAVLGGAVPSAADHASRPSEDMEALGHSPHPANFLTEPSATRHVNSDLAFWGNLAFNGNYNGFRVIDISNPANPTEVTWYNQCNGDQGDIVVWEDILVRAWNSPAPAGRICGGQPVPTGFEGVHVFDISNPAAPTMVGQLPLECGSHTVTLAGIQGGELIVYSNISSSTGCIDGTRANDDPAGDFMDIIGVPLNNPAGVRLIRREPLEGPATDVRTGCHDAGVILLNENKAACASADTINVWDIGANETPGGSLTDPEVLFTIREPGVGEAGTNGRWHSATFTWDGEVIAAGWEPGGGAEPECQTADPDVDKSMFFYDADTGAKLGQWVLPRGQDGAGENCTIHNYNVVPMLDSRKYIAVGGHYQAGTWAVDFSNPANPVTLAWSDPPPLVPADLGGAWSSYWYNDFVYESEITKGLNVFRVTDPALAANLTSNLPFLNPQTQMLPGTCKRKPITMLGTNGGERIVGTPDRDVVKARGGKDKVRGLSGKDVVCGGKGGDTIRGAGKRDRLYGQRGSDALNGGAGRDLCHGGPRRDSARRCEQLKAIP